MAWLNPETAHGTQPDLPVAQNRCESNNRSAGCKRNIPRAGHAKKTPLMLDWRGRYLVQLVGSVKAEAEIV
jgi:hypothetical protein